MTRRYFDNETDNDIDNETCGKYLMSVCFSRSQNTSSESTPRHPALGSHIMRCQPLGPRSRGQLSPVMLQEPGLDKRDTKIVVKTNNRREPVAKL